MRHQPFDDAFFISRTGIVSCIYSICIPIGDSPQESSSNIRNAVPFLFRPDPRSRMRSQSVKSPESRQLFARNVSMPIFLYLSIAICSFVSKTFQCHSNGCKMQFFSALISLEEIAKWMNIEKNTDFMASWTTSYSALLSNDKEVNIMRRKSPAATGN